MRTHSAEKFLTALRMKSSGLHPIFFAAEMISADSLLENEGVQRMSRGMLFPLSVFNFFHEVLDRRTNKVRLVGFVNNSHSFEHGFVFLPGEPKVHPGAGVSIFLFRHCSVSFVVFLSSTPDDARIISNVCVHSQPPLLKNLHQPISDRFGIIQSNTTRRHHR